jgi:activator of HSP90 ATPase
MKRTLLLLLLCFNTVSAQEKWSTNKALVSFEASVPFFEPIQARSTTTQCAFNTKKKTIVFVVIVKDFRFEKSLMQQHFNEHYLETKRYPKAIFKGSILKFDLLKINSFQSTYVLEGTITVHGKSKKMRVPASFKRNNNKLELSTSFNLNTDDFNIQIPFLVRDKIAQNVHVNLFAQLE